MLTQALIYGADYLDRKRRELTRLRMSLREIAHHAEGETASIRVGFGHQMHDPQDNGHPVNALALQGNLTVHHSARMARVDRALEKIDEGTYGLSDVSGNPIPHNRLEVMPDAIITVAEQEANEVWR